MAIQNAGKYSFVDLGILIGDTLIIADLHIGYEETMAREGILIPRFHLTDLMSRLGAMIVSANPKRIIIAGDIKHDFGRVLVQEWKDAAALFTFLSAQAKVTLVRGNHDKALELLARKHGLKLHDSLELDGYFIIHGDTLVAPPEGCHTLVIGHEHPAFSLREGGRVERFKCFLETRFNGIRLIVLPSANILLEGHDLAIEPPISPYLQGIDQTDIFIIAEPGKILPFGKQKLRQKK